VYNTLEYQLMHEMTIPFQGCFVPGKNRKDYFIIMAKRLKKRNNNLFSRYRILIIVGAVCVMLIAISAITLLSRSNFPETPDDDIIMQTPEPTPESTPSPVTTPDVVPEQTPESPAESTPTPARDPVNPLTGLPMDEEVARRRPIIISVSNERAAQPMNGVSGANIVYEMPVEGNITRMLFIYQDPADIIKVGSIRSARHYTVQIVESYDGILFASGGSEPAWHESRDRGVPFLNESTRIQTRDLNRVPGQRVGNLHSLTTTTPLTERNLPAYSESRGFRLMHEDDYELGLVFVDDGTPQNGSNAVDIEIKFGNAKSSFLTYDEATKTYGFSQFGRDVRDANNDTQAAFTNIIVIKTSITALGGQYGVAGRREMITTGSGEGFFINGGKYIEIEWNRATKSDPFSYTHKDGSVLALGTGRTYIGIVSMSGDMIPG